MSLVFMPNLLLTNPDRARNMYCTHSLGDIRTSDVFSLGQLNLIIMAPIEWF